MKSAHNAPIEMPALLGQDATIEDVDEESEETNQGGPSIQITQSRPYSAVSNLDGNTRFPSVHNSSKSDFSSSSSTQSDLGHVNDASHNSDEKNAANLNENLNSGNAVNTVPVTSSAPPAHMLTPQSSCSSSYPSPPENIVRDNHPILQSSFQMTPVLHSL